MKNASRLAALSLLAIFALSGCIRMQVDMTLQSDNTVDGSMVVAVQKGVGESLGMTDEDLLGELTGELEGDLDGAKQEPYDQDGYIGTKITFEGQSLDEVATDVGTEGLTITREGDVFIVDGPVDDLAGEEETGELP